MCDTESKPDSPKDDNHKTCGEVGKSDFRDPKTGRFMPGHPKKGGTGMVMGQKTRFTKLKDAFLDAFDELGGKDFVKTSAEKDPVEILKIMAKMLPTYSNIKTDAVIGLDVGSTIEIHFNETGKPNKGENDV